MAFTKKEWKDRLVEFAGRRKITNVTTLAAQIVDVERAEGTTSEEGSAFSAANMNDLEQRIGDAVAAAEAGIAEAKKSASDGKTLIAAAITAKRVAASASDTFATLAQKIGKIVLGSGNAGTGDVLAGKTFTNNDGVQYTGTMPNRGTLNWSGVNTTGGVSAGYYSGGTIDSRPSYNSGWNGGVTAADNRANPSSANYQAGYNAGQSAGKASLKKVRYTYNQKVNGKSFSYDTGKQLVAVMLVSASYTVYSWQQNYNAYVGAGVSVSMSGTVLTVGLPGSHTDEKGNTVVNIDYFYFE